MCARPAGVRTCNRMWIQDQVSLEGRVPFVECYDLPHHYVLCLVSVLCIFYAMLSHIYSRLIPPFFMFSRPSPFRAGHQGVLVEYGSPHFRYFNFHRRQRPSVIYSHQIVPFSLMSLQHPKQRLVEPTKISVISRRSHPRFIMTTVGVDGGLLVTTSDQSVKADHHGRHTVHYRGSLSW